MQRSIPTRILSIDGQGKISLTKEYSRKGELEASDDRRALLGGGFPSVSDDKSLPLSPTLQLNVDLASLEESDLRNLAEAELLRLQSIRFDSYEIEADHRVCIISEDATLLDSFVDNYGGVLEIEALLSRGQSPIYPEVVELNIEKDGDEHVITYTKNSAIDRNLCLYCGECGRVCPEKCITPDLYVEKRRCTYCKECETVCPAEAIDIHSVEEIKVRVPAIILLGSPAIELPEKSNSIYHGERIANYFSTIYPREVKEVVCHNSSICQYSARLNMGCGRCLASCPHGALSRKADGIAIDHLRCEECGNCIAVCPTGAMQNGYFRDDDLLNYLGGFSGIDAANLIIGEEKELLTLWWQSTFGEFTNTVFLEYPIIGSLSSYHLLLLYAAGFSRVVLVTNKKSGSDPLTNEIKKANSITRALFSVDAFELSEVDGLRHLQLTDVAHPMQTTVSASAHQNRRKGLSQVLQLLLSASPSEIELVTGAFDYVTIGCDSDKCSHCLACLNECKTLALQSDEHSLTLNHSAGLCVGCGVCVGVCPENALTMQEAVKINSSFFHKRELASSEAATCKKCGKVFGARKSLDRVLQILSGKEAVNTEHFEYCGTCRVVNIFEAEEL